MGLQIRIQVVCKSQDVKYYQILITDQEGWINSAPQENFLRARHPIETFSKMCVVLDVCTTLTSTIKMTNIGQYSGQPQYGVI